MKTYTSYILSKRIGEFLGESAPEPINNSAPYVDKQERHWFVKEEADAAGEDVAFIYQLHDILSCSFLKAFTAKRKDMQNSAVVLWPEVTGSYLNKQYFEGGFSAVEKALFEMMGVKP